MVVKYDHTVGILGAALRYKRTVIPHVLKNPLFWILNVFHVALSVSHRLQYFSVQHDHMELPMHLTKVTGGLMTFFVVFYTSNVFKRYNMLHESARRINVHSLEIVAFLAREIKNRNTIRRLTRMIVGSCFLFYFELTPDPTEESVGSVSREEWEQLRNMRLISTQEIQCLQLHCNDLGTAHFPSSVLLHWVQRGYRSHIAMIPELEINFKELRVTMEDVKMRAEFPMPFQYFHIMNLMMLFNLTLWAYALAFEDSYICTLIFLMTQMVFQGIRQLAVELTDPIGFDDVDFEVDEWMADLYAKSMSLTELSLDWELTNFEDEIISPLKAPGRGSMINLMVDIKGEDNGPLDDLLLLEGL